MSSPLKRPGRIGLPLIRWSDEENEFLVAHYRTMTMDNLLCSLPERTESSILQQAGKLGLWGQKHLLKADPWSDDELSVLTDYFPDNGIHVCLAFLPDRSRSSVALKIKRSGIRRRPGPRWNSISAHEWAYVLNNVERLGFVACAEAVSDTPDNIRDKCARRGFDCEAIDLAFNGGPFKEGEITQAEIDYIIERFPVEGGVRVARALGRSPTPLINFAKRRLGLFAPKPDKSPKFSVVRPAFKTRKEAACFT